jgi:glycosyltransferase involved in cell wall biosynthesis
MLGSVDIANLYEPISLRQLRTAIAKWLSLPLLQRLTGWSGEVAVDAVIGSVLRSGPVAAAPPQPVAKSAPATLRVSIVVTTLDRPDDLRLCLRSLLSQRTARAVQVLVVDNHPSSGKTQRVVADFPNVQLLNEPRHGVAYARNRGIAHSTGDVIVTTDDDVVAPPEWLERLLLPLARPDVSVVTGATLPLELETASQQLFERYRSPRPHASFEVDHAWFSRERRTPPTWTLGSTTNAAFRAELFRDPNVGFLCEALGPGTPVGDAEDSYAFYRVLKAGHVIVHEPAAIVWQRHRRTVAAFRRRRFAFGKGQVAYPLHTLLCDRDVRALGRMLGSLAPFRAYQLLRILRDELRGKNEDLTVLAAIEIAGNLAGPLQLMHSYARVRGLGRSSPLPAEPAAEATSESCRSDLG